MSNSENQEGYGPHLTFDGYNCDPELLNDMKLVFKFLTDLPKSIGMNKLTQPYVLSYDGGDKPDDYGVTGIVIIAESHISIHTYPHDKCFFLDIFSCKPFDVDKAKQIVNFTFKVGNDETNLVLRGKHFRR